MRRTLLVLGLILAASSLFSNVHAQNQPAQGSAAEPSQSPVVDVEREKLPEMCIRDSSNTFIRDYWSAWFNAHIDRVSLFKIKNLAYEEETADRVTIRLVKQVVTMENGGVAERLTPSELTLTRADGLWKITSERDFK